MTKFRKPSATNHSAPHCVSVESLIQTAYGPDRHYNVLPTIYPNAREAMRACHVIMDTSDHGYVSARPVRVMGG